MANDFIKWDIVREWESPAWYNERYTNKESGKHFIISAIGEFEGDDKPNASHIVGYYDKEGNGLMGQKEFKDRFSARAWVSKCMIEGFL